MSHESLVLQHLTKQFKPGRPVINDLSMEFKAGESVLFSGPNGSGKTTLLRILSINAFPTSGKVSFDGYNIHEFPYRYLKHVGLVYDDESMPQHMNADEILEWILRSRQIWKKDSPDQISAILDLLALSEARRDPLGTYSTGMRKKVQIASALISEPHVLILDEPLRGLDEMSKNSVLKLIFERVEKGAICLMASHGGDGVAAGFDRFLEFPLSD